MFIPLGPLNVPGTFFFPLPFGPAVVLTAQEVLESASNTVTFNQEAIHVIEESVSNNVTFTSEGTGGFAGENTVTFGQNVSPAGSVFNVSAENTVVFGQNATGALNIQPTSNTIIFASTVSPAGSVFNVSVGNAVLFTQEAVNNLKFGVANNVVIFGSVVQEINKFVAGTNVILFGQAVVHNQKVGLGNNLIIFGFDVSHNQVEESVADAISFGQDIISQEPIPVSANNNVAFGQNVVSSIKNVSASNVITFGVAATRAGSVYTRLADNTVLFNQIGARSFTESLITTITFTPSAVSHPNGRGTNNLILTQTAVGFATKAGQSTITFGQQVTVSVVRVLLVTNEVKFFTSMGLFGIKLNFDEYNPIIDESIKEHQLTNNVGLTDNSVGTKITNNSGSNVAFFGVNATAVVIP